MSYKLREHKIENTKRVWFKYQLSFDLGLEYGHWCPSSWNQTQLEFIWWSSNLSRLYWNWKSARSVQKVMKGQISVICFSDLCEIYGPCPTHYICQHAPFFAKDAIECVCDPNDPNPMDPECVRKLQKIYFGPLKIVGPWPYLVPWTKNFGSWFLFSVINWNVTMHFIYIPIRKKLYGSRYWHIFGRLYDFELGFSPSYNIYYMKHTICFIFYIRVMNKIWWGVGCWI